MRFAYVAAGAVVIGATVSEARSVPSSPHRLAKVARRQSRAIPIDPFILGSPLSKTGKAIPTEVDDRRDDGTNGAQMLRYGAGADGESSTPTPLSNQDTFAKPQDPLVQALESMLAVNTQPKSVVDLPGASAPEAPARPNFVNINPSGVPEYVIMNSPQTQGEMPSYAVPGATRQYIPTELAGPIYTVENDAQAESQAATRPFEGAYPLVFSAAHATGLPTSQILHTAQGVPISTGAPPSLMASILEELKLAKDQSITPNPTTAATGLPPPLLRALGGVEMPVTTSEKFAPCENPTKSPKDSIPSKDSLNIPSNDTSSPQAPSPVFRKLQSSNDTAPLANNMTLPVNGTIASPNLSATLGDSERAALSTGNTSVPLNGTALPLNLNATMAGSERATLPTDAGSNSTAGTAGTVLSALGDGQSSIPMNASGLTGPSDSSSNIPLNTTGNPISSALPSPIGNMASQE